MGIRDLFSPVNNMNTTQLQAFIDSNKEEKAHLKSLGDLLDKRVDFT